MSGECMATGQLVIPRGGSTSLRCELPAGHDGHHNDGGVEFGTVPRPPAPDRHQHPDDVTAAVQAHAAADRQRQTAAEVQYRPCAGCDSPCGCPLTTPREPSPVDALLLAGITRETVAAALAAADRDGYQRGRDETARKVLALVAAFDTGELWSSQVVARLRDLADRDDEKEGR